MFTRVGILLSWAFIFAQEVSAQQRTITVTNSCTMPIFATPYAQGPPSVQLVNFPSTPDHQTLLNPGNSVTFHVVDEGLTVVQYWFQTNFDKKHNKFPPPCDQSPCLRMQGTRASLVFEPLSSVNVNSYTILTDQGYNFEVSVFPTNRDFYCYQGAYAYGKYNGIGIENVDGMVIQCPNTYSMTVQLCPAGPPDQTRPMNRIDDTEQLKFPPSATPGPDHRTVTHVNNCSQEIWVQLVNNANNTVNVNISVVHIPMGGHYIYVLPNEADWGGRSFAKGFCLRNGQSCLINQGMEPCDPVIGCAPPATLFWEIHTPTLSNTQGKAWVDASAVDGFDPFPGHMYPVDFSSVPTGWSNDPDYNCGPISFGLDATKDCLIEPNFYQNTNAGIADVAVSLQTDLFGFQCLAPCKAANWPKVNVWKAGLGINVTQEPAYDYCCPQPMDPDVCRDGIITKTAYYKKLKSTYPDAYAFSYDDDDALHYCPGRLSYIITHCAGPDLLANRVAPKLF